MRKFTLILMILMILILLAMLFVREVLDMPDAWTKITADYAGNNPASAAADSFDVKTNNLVSEHGFERINGWFYGEANTVVAKGGQNDYN